MTFYAVSSPSSLQVKARKNGFRDSHQVLSAWGSDSYQLYHTVNAQTGQEEITVYYYRSPLAAARLVTPSDFLEEAPKRTTTKLKYDVFLVAPEVYKIYVIAEQTAQDSGNVTRTLYEHDIESSGNNKALIIARLDLGGICADKLRAVDRFIVLACKERA